MSGNTNDQSQVLSDQQQVIVKKVEKLLCDDVPKVFEIRKLNRGKQLPWFISKATGEQMIGCNYVYNIACQDGYAPGLSGPGSSYIFIRHEDDEDRVVQDQDWMNASVIRKPAGDGE